MTFHSAPPACPSYLDPAAWQVEFDAERARIQSDGWTARRDLFNRDYPAPYTGRIDEAAHARFAALCNN